LSGSYDSVAATYVDLGVGDLAPQPWLRAGLSAFAEAVRGLGPVLDVGCGPGTVTAYLAQLGLDVSGIDLSGEMVRHARLRYPDLRFEVASAPALDLARAARAENRVRLDVHVEPPSMSSFRPVTNERRR
jgi:SAM-dependent methyltransferase